MSDMTDDLDWYDPEDGYGDDTPVICKYCGKSEFYWGETYMGWRLLDYDGHVHECPDYKPALHIGTPQ